MQPELITIEQQPDLADRMGDLIEESWPTFMLQDPIGNQHWHRLYSTFPAFQVAMVDGERVIGQGNTIPIGWESPLESLPHEGWDWAFLRGFEGADMQRRPNCLVGLQIVLEPDAQGLGLSKAFVEHFRSVALAHGFERLIIPLRPTLKHRYPLTPMEDYITWMREGLPFDPWLRVHARHGARIIQACHRSMTISGTVSDWEDWSGMAFPATGTYVVDRALVPIQIDLEKDEGIYIEPNVWVAHDLSA